MSSYQVMEISIDWIRVDGHPRKVLNGIDALANSMKNIGLVSPIVVTSTGHVLAGTRRVAAARVLGWSRIRAYVVDTFDDALIVLLQTQSNDHIEQQRMMPSELVSLGLLIESMSRPNLLSRKREAGRRAAAKRLGRPIMDQAKKSLDDAPALTFGHVHMALGIAETQYYKAKFVVTAATDPLRSTEERAIAVEAISDMDSGRTTIGGAYDRVKNVKPIRTGRQPGPTIITANGQRRAISSAEAALSGISQALRQIESLHTDITKDEAASFMPTFIESRRILNVLITMLKDRVNETT